MSSSSNSSPYVVLTGNPNCGKTTLFNALTGLRARVGNYAGVTVERKEGRLLGHAAGNVQVLDLPGTYSLSPQSLDEQISRDVLFCRVPEVPEPAVVVVVVDASNLERNFYYASQVVELGYPTIIALNMIDVAEANGATLDPEMLSSEFGVEVIPMAANSGRGIADLKAAITRALEKKRDRTQKTRFLFDIPAALRSEVNALAGQLPSGEALSGREVEALLLITDERASTLGTRRQEPAIAQAVAAARTRLDAAGVDWRGVAIEGRYAAAAHVMSLASVHSGGSAPTLSDRLDQVVTHKVWGLLIFFGIMALMFLSIFTFARIPMDFLQDLVASFGDWVGARMPAGDLRELLVKGVIKGVGAVVVFVPQICLLFLFIGLLEDTGYMARAAFLMDRLMSKVGLHGKSFIPMLSSFACAIPGIMATRTIETPKDRLVTILVAPLMSCSARLPVYTLLIAACFPDRRIVAAATLWAMYLLGIVVALVMAWIFKKTLLQGPTPLLILELPPYKKPVFKVVMRHMWDRSRLFLRRAGTVILGINILLWFFATYPRHAEIARRFDAARQEVNTTVTNAEARALRLATIDNEQAGANLQGSFAGMLGRSIEPVLRPLGFDWKIGIGIISSFAAREVFVSTMSIVYNVGEGGKDDEQANRTLADTLRHQVRPDGTPVYTSLASITLMVFYVMALQCISTVAIVRRETNTWKWPIFQWVYMGALAWVLAFITWQGGHLLGFK